MNLEPQKMYLLCSLSAIPPEHLCTACLTILRKTVFSSARYVELHEMMMLYLCNLITFAILFFAGCSCLSEVSSYN